MSIMCAVYLNVCAHFFEQFQTGVLVELVLLYEVNDAIESFLVHIQVVVHEANVQVGLGITRVQNAL